MQYSVRPLQVVAASVAEDVVVARLKSWVRFGRARTGVRRVVLSRAFVRPF